MKKNGLSRLLDGIRRERHDYRASLQVFPDLDVDHVAADMRLAELGGQRGARGEPPTEMQALDDVELAVVERIESERRSAHGILLDELRTYGERAAGLDFEGRFALIRQAAPEAASDIKAAAANGRDELNRLRGRLRDAEADVAAFRGENRISRSAVLETPGSRSLKIGLLLFILVVEVVVNGAFLAKGSELGLLGGAIEAFGFALLNVGAAFLLGQYARQIGHRNVFHKLFGLASVVAFVVFAIALNIALAHYREVSGSFIDDAGARVVDRLAADPLGLTDIKSWLFFGIGMLFAVIAFIDGVKLGDPYPGYGDVAARREEAHRAYIDRKSDLVAVLEDLRDGAIGILEEAGRDLSTRRAEHDAILENRARLLRLFEAHQAHLERAGASLLGYYHEANRQARPDDKPPPETFWRPFAIERIAVESEMPDLEGRKAVRKMVDKAQEALVRQVTAVNDKFDEAVESYHEIDNLFPEDHHGARTQPATA